MVKKTNQRLFPKNKHIQAAFLPKPGLVLRSQAGLLARFNFSSLPIGFNSGIGPKSGFF